MPTYGIYHRQMKGSTQASHTQSGVNLFLFVMHSMHLEVLPNTKIHKKCPQFKLDCSINFIPQRCIETHDDRHTARFAKTIKIISCYNTLTKKTSMGILVERCDVYTSCYHK